MHFWRCEAYPEGQTFTPLIVCMASVLVSLPEGVLSGEKGGTGAVVNHHEGGEDYYLAESDSRRLRQQ